MVFFNVRIFTNVNVSTENKKRFAAKRSPIVQNNSSYNLLSQIFIDICAMELTKTSYPKEKIKVLLLENISDAAVKRFTSNGYTNVERLSKALPEEELVKKMKDVHLLGIRSKTQITAAVLNTAEKLQAIGCFCIGTNQVNLNAATEKGVA